MSGCCTGAQTNCPLFFSSCKPYFLLDSETPLMKHRSIQWHCLSCEIMEKQCQWVNFKWQTALIPYTYKFWILGYWNIPVPNSIFLATHTCWTFILPTSVESENMYSSLNTYWLNKIIFPQTHICWITPLHVHSLSRGVGETQRRKEYVTHLKHELKVSLCVCLFLQRRWNIYFQVQEFVIPKNF